MLSGFQKCKNMAMGNRFEKDWDLDRKRDGIMTLRLLINQVLLKIQNRLNSTSVRRHFYQILGAIFGIDLG